MGSEGGVREDKKELCSIWTGNVLPVLGRSPVEANDWREIPLGLLLALGMPLDWLSPIETFLLT